MYLSISFKQPFPLGKLSWQNDEKSLTFQAQEHLFFLMQSVCIVSNKFDYFQKRNGLGKVDFEAKTTLLLGIRMVEAS